MSNQRETVLLQMQCLICPPKRYEYICSTILVHLRARRFSTRK